MMISRAARSIGLAVMLIISSGVVNLVAAAPASAVSCYGDYCSGKDPMATGCANDAYTVTSVVQPGAGALEVRWSPTCKTNWARLTIYPQGRIGTYVNGAALSAVQSTGYTQTTWISAWFGNQTYTYWSPMIYSPVKCVKAVYDAKNGFFHLETKCV